MLLVCVWPHAVISCCYLLGILLFSKNFEGHIQDFGVVEHPITTVRTRLNVYAHIDAVFIIRATEVITHRLVGHIELVSNFVD